MNKIAIVVDSGCNVPVDYVKEKGIYVIPLRLHYHDREYLDGVDIDPAEVYRSLQDEIPTTSLPTGDDVIRLFDQIKADGFTEVLCITISSNLSGTNNIFRLLINDIEDMNIRLIDTKNIAIGSGFLALVAQECIEKGYTLDETYEKVSANVKNSKVLFCVDTLEYLRKGGRIGLVSGFIGEKLNLKPVITCNDDGVYYTAAKSKGKKNAVKKIVDLVCEFINESESYQLCISNGGADNKELQDFHAYVLERLPNATTVYTTDISPTLGVHTGPGLLGLGVFRVK